MLVGCSLGRYRKCSPVLFFFPVFLQIVIYLLECIQPPGYYDEDFTLLQADARIVRQLVHRNDPELHRHLRRMRRANASDGVVAQYREPALCDPYTMQWFLLLFATWLPLGTLERLWDLFILLGNEMMFRFALVFWTRHLKPMIMDCQETEDYYRLMTDIQEATQHASDDSPLRVDADALIVELCDVSAVFLLGRI